MPDTVSILLSDIREPPKLGLRDGCFIWGGMALLSLIAWVYLARMAAMPNSMSGMDMAMPMSHRWSALDLWLTFLMWAVMMIAMMAPSLTPTVTMYARMIRGQRQSRAEINLILFVAGYLAMWTAFSGAATLAQAAIDQTAPLSESMSVNPILGSLLLAAAGIYQFTPLKGVCMTICRSPLSFFMHSWRHGYAGAFAMGIHSGWLCIACCWLLMALLFVAGVMNLLWVAGISVFVLLEKVMPYSRTMTRLSGVALIIGAVLLALYR